MFWKRTVWLTKKTPKTAENRSIGSDCIERKFNEIFIGLRSWFDVKLEYDEKSEETPNGLGVENAFQWILQTIRGRIEPNYSSLKYTKSCSTLWRVSEYIGLITCQWHHQSPIQALLLLLSLQSALGDGSSQVRYLLFCPSHKKRILEEYIFATSNVLNRSLPSLWAKHFGQLNYAHWYLYAQCAPLPKADDFLQIPFCNEKNIPIQ